MDGTFAAVCDGRAAPGVCATQCGTHVARLARRALWLRLGIQRHWHHQQNLCGTPRQPLSAVGANREATAAVLQHEGEKGRGRMCFGAMGGGRRKGELPMPLPTLLLVVWTTSCCGRLSSIRDTTGRICARTEGRHCARPGLWAPRHLGFVSLLAGEGGGGDLAPPRRRSSRLLRTLDPPSPRIKGGVGEEIVEMGRWWPRG